MLLQKIDEIDRIAVGLVARLIPWLAPVPSAYLVYRAAIEKLDYPVFVGVIAAFIIEALGLSATATALDLYIFNQNRRKTDPPAPIILPLILLGVYLVTTTALTIIVEIVPTLATYTPIIFPSLSLGGAVILALQINLSYRRKLIADEKAERKVERQANRLEKRQIPLLMSAGPASTELSNNGNLGISMDRLQAGRKAKLDARMDALVDILQADPDIEIIEAARQIHVSRQTVYSYLKQLEQAGRIKRNGHGMEVIE
jgi:hypothetical protein